MRIIGCDLHARQQTIGMLDSDTGELEEKILEHQGEIVRGVLFHFLSLIARWSSARRPRCRCLLPS
jgi:hypothetical protein